MILDFNHDYLQDEIQEIEESCQKLRKILNGQLPPEAADEEIEKRKNAKANKVTIEEIKINEKYEKALKGNSGKGEGMNYAFWCPTCFIEYQISEITRCTNCKGTLMSMEERHRQLTEKVEKLKTENNKKKYRRVKYENWLKSQDTIKLNRTTKKGPTDYMKWNYYESSSDEDMKQPVLPRHDPNFLALEKQINIDIKRKEEAMRKSLRAKEEGNAALKDKKYKKAIKCYSDAIYEYNNNMVLYTNRATAYIKIEEWRNACDDCDKVINYWDVFEDEITKHLDIYIKALTRKAYALEREKNYKEALECIDKAKERTESQEIIDLEKQIKASETLHIESWKTWNLPNDNGLTSLNKLIDLLRKSIKDTSDFKWWQALSSHFDIALELLEKSNSQIKNLDTDDNKYILFWNINNAISCFFTLLNCLSIIKNTPEKNDIVSSLVTKVLQTITLINSIPKYVQLINNVKGYNYWILFLFTTQSKEHKISITHNQALLIMNALESASLNENCRKTWTDIGQWDTMCEIVLKKYNLSNIDDEDTSIWLSKIYTFICNICYHSQDIQAKISWKVSGILYPQWKSFTDKYNCNRPYHRSLLCAIISLIVNWSSDTLFRKSLGKERNFLKFVSENWLVELISHQIIDDGNIDEIYEKTMALFYNWTFITGEEKDLVTFYYDIHIEAFLAFYINNKGNIRSLTKENNVCLWRATTWLGRMVKIDSRRLVTVIFNKAGTRGISNSDNKENTLNEEDLICLLNNLLKYVDTETLTKNKEIVDQVIRIFAHLIKGINNTNNIRSYINTTFIKELISRGNKVIRYDCGVTARNVNKDNYERVVNLLSLYIAILDKFKENAVDMKEMVEWFIIICKEKTDLLRENSAYLLARFAKASPEMDEYFRGLHGMDVLMNISQFLNK